VNLGEPVAPRAMSFSPDGRTLTVMAVNGIDRSTREAIDVGSRRARQLQSWPDRFLRRRSAPTAWPTRRTAGWSP
jgi:hypothetical protein